MQHLSSFYTGSAVTLPKHSLYVGSKAPSEKMPAAQLKGDYDARDQKWRVNPLPVLWPYCSQKSLNRVGDNSV